MLAVKPQMYPTVLKNIVNVVTEESVIISIAPGITIASIKNALGSNIRVVRAMPNTPALIGEGMTGVSYNMTDFHLTKEMLLINSLIHLERLFMLMKTYGWNSVCKWQLACICIYVH